MAVRKSLLEKFSGKCRRCWTIIHRFSGSTKCYPCQGLGIFRQQKWLLENRPRLRECSWMFFSEAATAFLSFSERMSARLKHRLGSLWPFRGVIQAECGKVRKKSRNGFPGPPGPRGQKSQKRVQKKLKILNSFLTLF